jgi:hypothetical protein
MTTSAGCVRLGISQTEQEVRRSFTFVWEHLVRSISGRQSPGYRTMLCAPRTYAEYGCIGPPTAAHFRGRGDKLGRKPVTSSGGLRAGGTPL